MRTTLDIDDDILQAAKELARLERKTAGQVLSELARKGLTQAPAMGLSEEAAGFTGFGRYSIRTGKLRPCEASTSQGAR